MQKYTDPHRKVGSQKETSIFTQKSDFCSYNGYQKFKLYPDKIVPESRGLISKIKIIDSTFDSLVKAGQVNTGASNSGQPPSMLDIGCSNGGIGFYAAHKGVRDITLMDHDQEYIANVQRGIDFLHTSGESGNDFGNTGNTGKKIRALCADVTAINQQYDLITIFAVIHWIYSCTSGFGSIHKIIDFLRSKTRNYLLIEWVDPEDGAIKYFKHLKFNPKVHSEPYSRENFLTALHSNFPIVRSLGKINATREMFLASDKILDCLFQLPGKLLPNYRQLSGSTAEVYIDPGYNFAIKVFKGKYLPYGVFSREVYWLQTLQNSGFTPVLRHFDPDMKYIIMSYCGERITDRDKVLIPDFADQLAKIRADLAEKYDCDPVDIKLDSEVLCCEGEVFICDFGWCRLKSTGDFTLGGIVQDVPPAIRKHFRSTDTL